MVKLADTADLSPAAARRESSSLSTRTNWLKATSNMKNLTFLKKLELYEAMPICSEEEQKTIIDEAIKFVNFSIYWPDMKTIAISAVAEYIAYKQGKRLERNWPSSLVNFLHRL